MGVAYTFRVEAELSPGVWSNISADLVAAEGLRIDYGIQGNGPLDSVAGTGMLEFTLRNDAGNAGGTQGWYSPLHASVRAGWNYDVPVRVIFTYGTDRTKFYGKLRVITPDAGAYRRQRVSVVAYDLMRDLAEADIREVDLQVNKSEDELVEAVLAALPADSQPVATDLDAGVDLVPYAFHDVGDAEKALSLMKKVAVSSLAFLAMTGSGTLIMRNRQSRALGTSAFTFANTMHGLAVPSSLDQTYDAVRATTHPKTIDPAATTVLYALTGTPPSVAAGATLVLWGAYRSSDDATRLIGGLTVVDPLVSGTDYAGNAAADGSGADLTTDLAVTIDPFATTCKFTITNNGASTVYLVDGSGNPFLQCRGKRVLDDGPRTFEASTGSFPVRTLAVDLPYQDDDYFGASVASYLKAQYATLANQIDEIEFLANDSDALMTQALDREPGDIITITETMTGVSAVKAVIHRVSLEVSASGLLTCRWGLAPASPFTFWQWGVPGASEWGETTVYGF